MATLAVTYTAGSETGAALRELARQITAMSLAVPDRTPTGASTVVTFDNAPSTGNVSVQITAGPYQSSLFIA